MIIVRKYRLHYGRWKIFLYNELKLFFPTPANEAWKWAFPVSLSCYYIRCWLKAKLRRPWIKTCPPVQDEAPLIHQRGSPYSTRPRKSFLLTFKRELYIYKYFICTYISAYNQYSTEKFVKLDSLHTRGRFSKDSGDQNLLLSQPDWPDWLAGGC